MAELKTRPNDKDVNAFIDSVKPEWKRDDSRKILQLLQRVTNEDPVMWGDSIVGFGTYHYTYKTGREGDWFLTGFSPRKQSFTIYMMGGSKGSEQLLKKLGKYKMSVGCLYFNKLDDINLKALEKLVSNSVEVLRQAYK